MPPKYSRKRTIRRPRRVYKKKTRRVARVPRLMSSTGFSRSLNANLKYVTLNDTISAPGPTIVYQDYRANSLYDPTVALGGHQPLYRDQLAAIYEKYLVYAITVQIRGFVQSGDAIMVVGYRGGTAVQPSTVSWADEEKRYNVLMVNQYKPIRYKRTFQCATIMGQTKAQYSNDAVNNSAYQGFDPVAQAHIDVGIASPDGGGTFGTASIRVELTYHVRVFQPVTVPQS